MLDRDFEELYLRPLTFNEFLLARNHEKLARIARFYGWRKKISPTNHKKLMNLFREYVLVGGMPAAVKSWIENRSLKAVREVHEDIIQSYREDTAFYGKDIPRELFDKVLASIPKQLGSSFVYKRAARDVPPKQIKEALKKLYWADVIRKVPSRGQGRDKAILNDVGLCSTQLGLTRKDLRQHPEFDYQGIAHQVVGQMLHACGDERCDRNVRYWRHREIEVPLGINCHWEYVPIELSSGSIELLKGIHTYMGQWREENDWKREDGPRG